MHLEAKNKDANGGERVQPPPSWRNNAESDAADDGKLNESVGNLLFRTVRPLSLLVQLEPLLTLKFPLPLPREVKCRRNARLSGFFKVMQALYDVLIRKDVSRCGLLCLGRLPKLAKSDQTDTPASLAAGPSTTR